ncbi:MAG: hypothetical protein QHI48_09965 [Bacteroidota bacterium]|nr:hypothetical protein [Bacteroidota bacterium]
MIHRTVHPVRALVSAVRFPLIACMLLAVSCHAQSPMEDRVDSVRNFFAGPKTSADVYGALERTFRDSLRGQGCRILHEMFQSEPSDIVARFRLALAYLFARDRLPDSTQAAYRRLWASVPLLPMQSEHQRVAAAAAHLLAAEGLGPAAAWYNGLTTEENRRSAASELDEWIRTTAAFGQQDFDSPTYGPLFFTAMLAIDRFSSDRSLGDRARVMATWLLADYFHEYIGGQFGGAHGRENMYSAMQPLSSDLSTLAWLYFGDGVQSYSREQYIATLFDYRPPKAVMHLALGKKQPFTAVEVKRSADRIRRDTVRTRSVVKSTYIAPPYMVGHVDGGLLQPREQHTWDVTWWCDTGSTTLFTMHPYSEAAPLTEFHPHDAATAYRIVASEDPYYGTTTKTVGGSPFEYIFQHKNTVIALYDIPDIKRFPFICGFLPLHVDAFDIDSLRTGWITIKAGDVYLAYYPLRPGRLTNEQFGRRIFSRYRRNGAVVQVASRAETGSYASFRTRILRTVPDTSAFFTKGLVAYRTIFGDRLEARIGKSLRVNGIAQKRSLDMLFDSPWLSSRRGSGVLTITTPGERLVIDIPRAEIRHG